MAESDASTTVFVERMPRHPLVWNNHSMAWISDRIAGIVENKAPLWWWVTIAITSSFAAFGVFCILYLLFTGVGVWGNNIPVGWAWDITNFVFWIGIGHAGTLISAILHLCRQKWRTSINRAAEAMTLFAVICAGIFPAIHVGRIWMVWFMAPVPNPNWIWPNFRSPLMWDVFAVSTYFTVSVLFWYLGLVPDLATMRDRAKGRVSRTVYWILSFGWRGGNRQWRHYEMAYLVLAGISTPLVLSVHSTVSFDFATSLVPGWHTTIFPPYFVAGAIFGGFAMVLTLMLPARSLYKLHDVFTWDHIDVMCKLLLADGLDRGIRVLYGVFCGVLWSEPVRAIRVFEPIFRALLVGFLDHVHLQRDYAAAYVGSRVPQKLGHRLLRVDVRERGHVVRALRDICYLAAPGFFTVRVAYVLPYLGGRVHFHWNTRNLPDPLFVIYPLPSNGRDVGGQECAS